MSDYVYFKFKFHKKRYRRLLEQITEIADGESMNLAMRDQIIIWFENERRQKLPQLGQPCPPQLGQNQPNQEEDLSAALDDLEAAFGE